MHAWRALVSTPATCVDPVAARLPEAAARRYRPFEVTEDQAIPAGM